MQPQAGTKRERKLPQLEEILAIDLPAKHWKALYVLALRRIARRDKDFAEALSREFLRCAYRFMVLRHPSDPRMVTTEAKLDAKFEAMLSEQLSKNLSRKRDYQDSSEFLHHQYLTIREQLLRTNRAMWGGLTQKYWRMLGKEGTIPKDIKTMLKANLKTTRAARTAALQILADITNVKGGDRRDSLRVQFSRAGLPL